MPVRRAVLFSGLGLAMMAAAELRGKDAVTIRFQPHDGNIADGLCGCEVLKCSQAAP